MNHQIKRAFMAMLLSVFCFVAYAQKTVTGTVVDTAGEPMSGVSILVDGTTIGGVTDFDGNFSIKDVPENGVLRISYVGYKDQKISVAGKSSINVTMQEDAMGRDEIVVVGYGTMKKKDLTGAVASVKQGDIAQVAAPNAMQAMQAKVPGVDMTQSSGQAGAGVSITLRGNRSISASNSPLIIVDGVEYSGDLDVAANDIESMDVLKDAASTAIYGTKGANGVIIITTKRGQSGKTRVDFSAYLAFKSPTNAVKSMYGNTEVQRFVDRENYKADLESGNWGSSNKTYSDVFGETTIAGNDDYKIADLIARGDFVDHEQKRRKANENLYIYVLIADQLGLYDIKNELEDLSFKNYLANKYEKIDTLVKETAPARNKLLSDFKLSLMRVLVTTGVTCRLAVVKKSYFNIYQMMQNDAMAFEDIDNFQTVRIIIDKEPGEDEQSIYLKHFNLYAAIINKYTQKENSHRDYINKPKDNGFKALVFTVLYQGSWVEIQILTAENDLAAHKGYYPNNPERTGLKVLQKKMVSFNSDDDTDTIIRVFRTLVEHHVSSIYVYSPDGKIVELPEGSTVLDYAYSIHTSLGNHFVAAQVGSNIVYKDYILKSTDKVQVITSPSVKPDNSWMKYLKSDHSKEALSKYLRSHQCTIDYDKDRGEMEFNRLMCENHIIPTPKFLGLLLAFYKAPSSEVFFRDIAQGNVKDLLENAKKLKISSNKWDLDFDLPEQPVDSPVVDIDYKKPYKLTKGLHYMLPNCCRPIPGDEAFAYVGDDGVLYVHRKECSFTKERLATRGKEITSVIWDDSIDNALAYVKLHGSNRLGLIRDVGDIVAREHVNIKSFNINENDRLFDGCLLVYIHNTAQLNKLMTALSAVTNVIKVFRTNYVNGRYIAVS